MSDKEKAQMQISKELLRRADGDSDEDPDDWGLDEDEDERMFNPLSGVDKGKEEEFTMMMRQRVATEVLGSESISAFMELSPKQRNTVYRKVLITKGWIMVLDDEQDTYPLGLAVQLIMPDAEDFLGHDLLVQEARQVYWNENAFFVGSPDIPLRELLAHPGAKQHIARIKLEIRVPMGRQDQKDATKGIEGIGKCKRLKWVSIDLKGLYPSSADEYLETMRDSFESVALRCQPDEGFHIQKTGKGFRSGGGVQVEGGWEKDVEGKKRGDFQKILKEEVRRDKANRRLRVDQFDAF